MPGNSQQPSILKWKGATLRFRRMKFIVVFVDPLSMDWVFAHPAPRVYYGKILDLSFMISEKCQNADEAGIGNHRLSSTWKSYFHHRCDRKLVLVPPVKFPGSFVRSQGLWKKQHDCLDESRRDSVIMFSASGKKCLLDFRQVVRDQPGLKYVIKNLKSAGICCSYLMLFLLLFVEGSWIEWTSGAFFSNILRQKISRTSSFILRLFFFGFQQWHSLTFLTQFLLLVFKLEEAWFKDRQAVPW